MHFSLFVGKELLTNNGLLMGNTVLMDVLQIVLLNTLNAKYLNLTIHDILLNLVQKGNFFVFAFIKLTFCFFYTKVLASEVPTILKKFDSDGRSDLEGAILKLSWQPGRVYMTSFCPIWNWQEEEKPATDLGILHKVSKIFFFSNNYPLHYLQYHHSEFGSCLAQNNIVQVQP